MTRLLQAGDRDALLEVVYDELRRLASGRMTSERPGHTLQVTALVHEAYLRLFGQSGATWEKRRHFYATASEAMRRILIEHARRVSAEKRGAAARRVSLGDADTPVELDLEQAPMIHEALDMLARENERAAAVARLRFLAGLSVEETADALSISVRSVHRDWNFARARMFELLVPSAGKRSGPRDDRGSPERGR